MRALIFEDTVMRRPGSLSKIRALARTLAKEDETQPQSRPAARALARKGRGSDTEIAHVTPGEIVVPRELQTPEVMAALDWAAAGAGLTLDRLRVGAHANSINPQTGAPEFFLDGLRDWFSKFGNKSPSPSPPSAQSAKPPMSDIDPITTGAISQMGDIVPQLDEITVRGARRNEPKVDRYFDRFVPLLEPVANEMNVPLDLLLTQALAEGGWDVGTRENDSNSVFGFSRNEKPIRYPTPEAAIEAYRQGKWPKKLYDTYSPDAFLAKLRADPVGTYNSVEPEYNNRFRNIYEGLKWRLPAWRARGVKQP